jgi:hypothetical protein
MQNGSGKGGKILDMGELSRAVMASEGEPTVVDFAPPNNPQRIQRVAELTGASIRRTCTDAGRAVIELVDQADAVVRQLRNDANAFVQSLDDIGNAHAARVANREAQKRTSASRPFRFPPGCSPISGAGIGSTPRRSISSSSMASPLHR